MFESICLENLGNGKFKSHTLPIMAQLSSVNDIVIFDMDKDGIKDVVIAGNMYGSEVETPRNDSSVGLYMKGEGNCTFKPIPMHESGLSLPFDVKDLELIKINNKQAILVGINNEPLRVIEIRN